MNSDKKEQVRNNHYISDILGFLGLGIIAGGGFYVRSQSVIFGGVLVLVALFILFKYEWRNKR